MVRACLFIVILTTLGGAVRGEEAALLDRQRIVTDLARRAVEITQFRTAPAAAPLVHHGPALRWSNPTVGEVHGEIHLWTDDGRPACIGSVYRWFTPNWGATLEVASLVDRPLAGRQQGREREFWKPAPAPVRWEALAGKEAPADTPAARLIQMRRILRDFTATLRDTRQTEEAVERRLRLMPQPLFRYPPPSPTATYLDGALFSFVEGTDPEVLILLECGAEAADAARGAGPAWRWGAVRMNKDAQGVSISGRAAWSADFLEHARILSAPGEPYAYFVLDDQTGEVKP